MPEAEIYIKSVRIGDRDVPDRTLDLTQGAGNVEIVAASSSGRLEGSVIDENQPSQNGAAVSGANVVLVPEIATGDFSGGVRSAATDTKGYFSFKSIPPGSYTVFACEGLDSEQWSDPELAKALGGQAEQVQIGENEKKQLQLKLIPADQMAQILGRLGL
jgi:hypothetical protein